ncbi:hypothetical protein [Kribbella sp. DT2]|uniref:hypothetical protein n=1 Tax=Kribbella sp. DT2 TaxID=3393427 RepID=UPI003CEE9F8F
MIGPIDRPEYVIVGRYRSGELVVFAHTTALTESQSVQLGAVLTPAKPGHPWPAEISTRWRSAKRPLTKVEPTLVVELAADAAAQAGRVRHAARFVRLRPDVARPTYRHFPTARGTVTLSACCPIQRPGRRPGLCETSRRLLALLRMLERCTASYGADPIDVDGVVIDAWFGRYSPLTVPAAEPS